MKKADNCQLCEKPDSFEELYQLREPKITKGGATKNIGLAAGNSLQSGTQAQPAGMDATKYSYLTVGTAQPAGTDMLPTPVIPQAQKGTFLTSCTLLLFTKS